MFPSRDSVLDPPSCVTAPLIVSRASGGSSSCIQLRPHEPQLCGRLLLNFYPPPECSSIGLSHIAVYARPVLSDMTQPSNSTDHILTRSISKECWNGIFVFISAGIVVLNLVIIFFVDQISFKVW